MSFYNSVKGDNLEILYLPLEDRIFFKGSLMMVWENGRCSKTENIFIVEDSTVYMKRTKSCKVSLERHLHVDLFGFVRFKSHPY